MSPSRTSCRPTAYPQIMLFGDSITQQAELTFAATLRQEYIRRADIVNRGFSGYTSKMGLDLLPKFFPLPEQAKVRVMTVFFGANDACLPGNAQHVPIEEYVDCLRSIILHELVRGNGAKVVLIVPPPVDEYQFSDRTRTAANTKRYADACRQLGRELKLPVVDLWMVFMTKANWDGTSSPLPGSKECPKNEVLAGLLSDGLHFTPKAYSILSQELTKVIKASLSEETAEHMPMVFPAWEDCLEDSRKNGSL